MDSSPTVPDAAFKIINQPGNVFIVSSEKLIEQIARQLAVNRLCECRRNFSHPKSEYSIFYDPLIYNPYSFDRNIKREVYEDCAPNFRREMIDLTQALESSNSFLSRCSLPKTPKSLKYVRPNHGIYLFGLENSEIIALYKKKNNLSIYQARLELWNRLDKHEKTEYSSKTLKKNKAKRMND